MTFLEPQWLLLALVVLLFWVGPWKARHSAHALIRSGVWLALVLALAHPVWHTDQAQAQRVLLVDRSASQAQDPAPELFAALEGLVSPRTAERWTVAEFGGSSPSAINAVNGSARNWEQVELKHTAGASDLSGALGWAASRLPDQTPAGVIVVSDGLSSDGFPTRALSELRARGIPVSMIHQAGPTNDVRPVALEIHGAGTGAVRVGAPCSLVATIEGSGQVVTCTLVDVSGSEARELARVENVAVDGPTLVPMSFEPPQAGFIPVELRVAVESGQDARPGDEVWSTTLAVQDPLRVAYLGGRMQSGAERLAGLVGPGFEIDSQSEPDLAGSDLVLLDDRPAQALSKDLQEQLVEAVTERGMGLVAAGGEAAFGPGGYHNQPLETLLPVEMVQKEEKRDPSTSLVLIIDTSGSMGGNRVQLAKQVSRLAIRRLLPHDKVGIVEFYGAKRWAVPLQPASNSIEIERALNRLDAGGGTVILPAIEEAYYGLKNVRTRYKHVLILTDGGVETGAFEPLARRMADDGINVSTVLVGPDAHSEFLVNIANWGQGRFYSVPNRFNLPEILLKQPASAKLPAYRPGIVSVSVHGGRGWWGDVDAQAVPSISGYVETRLRPGAERLIETTGERHPVLASWRYGLGRVSAMTTEPTGPGTESWREWSDYGSLLARVLMRTADDGTQPYAYALQRDGDEAILVAESRRAGAAPPSAESVDGTPGVWRFFQVSPDRWEARAPIPREATVHLVAKETGSARNGLRLVLPAQVGAATELQVPSSMVDRWRVATESLGGRFTPALPSVLSSLPVSSPAVQTASKRLAPWFALLALLLYMFDLLFRRLRSFQS